ncbi:MAG: ArnT family glycosyltransferase [Chitinophagales bacterium]
MLIILFIATAFFVFLNFSCVNYYKEAESKFRSSFIQTLVFISTFILISAEVLNLFDAINSFWIAISWTILLLLSIINWWRWGKHFPKKLFSIPGGGFERFLFYSIVFILCITGITAIVAFPNNWDSMIYHLSRVMHWIQNGNVEFYPTEIDRQLTQPPLAEYIILHFQLLSNIDRFASLVQWLFFAGNIAVVSLIAASFNVDKKNQLIAGFFAATIPMAILQSNSTQNDLVVSFFIMAAIWLLIKNIKTGFIFRDTIPFYVICALAILAKGTAFIFLFPVVLAFTIMYLYKKSLRAIPSFFCGLIIVGLLYFPFANRNYKTFNSPLGKTYGLNNNAYGISPMFSNGVKNVFMHFRTSSPPVNRSLTDAAVEINRISGLDIDSPNYNWQFSPPFSVGYFSTQEDSAGNPLHVILFFLCILIYLFNKDLRKNKLLSLYLVLVILMFLTFCYVLKWQVWHVRLQLPMFIASGAFLGIVVNKFSNKIAFCVVIVILLFSGVFLFLNESRPWLRKENIFNTGKTTQYFKSAKPLQQPFIEMSEMMHRENYNALGFVSWGSSWEYPFFALNSDIKDFRMENIHPENETILLQKKPAFNNFSPDIIVISRFDPDVSGLYFYNELQYELIRKNNAWSIYKRSD